MRLQRRKAVRDARILLTKLVVVQLTGEIRVLAARKLAGDLTSPHYSRQTGTSIPSIRHLGGTNLAPFLVRTTMLSA